MCDAIGFKSGSPDLYTDTLPTVLFFRRQQVAGGGKKKKLPLLWYPECNVIRVRANVKVAFIAAHTHLGGLVRNPKLSKAMHPLPKIPKTMHWKPKSCTAMRVTLHLKVMARE